MVSYKNRPSLRNSWPWWRWILTGLNILALGLSAILAWHYLIGGSMAGCGSGSPCDQVLNSRWSVLAGIFPVSGLAIGVYLALLVAGFYIGPATEAPIRRLAWKAMLILAGVVAGSALWFIAVQKWIIEDFCVYCMTAHITGLLLSALIFWRALKDTEERAMLPLHSLVMVINGLLLAGIMAVTQVVFTPSAGYNNGESQYNLPAIDYHAAPVIGSPDAPYVVTLLFDYQCPHCQKIHFMLDDAVHRYDGKLAFALCPTPLNNRCNPYIPRKADMYKNSCELAKIGLAVWIAKRTAYPVFENWMFTFESGSKWRPRSPEAARAKAIKLVGWAKFDAAWSDPWIETYLHTCVQIYGQTIQNGKGGVPKLVFGSRWVIPESYNIKDFINTLQNSLAIPEP